jgi:hypothetical protein
MADLSLGLNYSLKRLFHILFRRNVPSSTWIPERYGTIYSSIRQLAYSTVCICTKMKSTLYFFQVFWIPSTWSPMRSSCSSGTSLLRNRKFSNPNTEQVKKSFSTGINDLYIEGSLMAEFKNTDLD